MTLDDLTPRQRTVIELAAQGLTREQIGREMYVSADTVSSHLRVIYRLTGTHNRLGALAALGLGVERTRPAARWQRLDGDLIAVPREVLRELVRVGHLLTDPKPQPAAAAQIAARALRAIPNPRALDRAERTRA
jgi:DNA-binding CsgD family transcriptional regulator